MKFSIGYNHDIKFLQLLDTYREYIESIYFPIPSRYFGSGRCIPQGDNYPNEIIQLINRCKALNITAQLLINPTCGGGKSLEKGFFSKIIDYIQKLLNLGLKSIILSNPLYIQDIKRLDKDIQIESSVNCFVRTVEHALYLRDLGIDILVIDRDINRNIPLIKTIKNKTALKLKIMLNEGCIRNCPFRVMHYNYLSHGYLSSHSELMEGIFPDKFCISIFQKNPDKFFSIPFIPPQAVKHYFKFVDYYKLSTRVFPTAKISLCLQSYINQEVKGNLLDILDCSGLSYFEYIDCDTLSKNRFFENMLRCNNNCKECKFCSRLMCKAMVINSDFLEGQQKSKENKKAIKIYKRILKVSMDKVHIYLKLGKAYFNLNRHKQATELMTKIMHLAPKQIDGYVSLGNIYEQMKKYNKALELYQRSLRLFPQNENILLGIIRVYFQLKKYKATIKNINLFTDLNYKADNINFILGCCYERIGKYKEAIVAFKKEEVLSPGNAKINFSLAKCYRRTGQIKASNKEIYKGGIKLKKQKI